MIRLLENTTSTKVHFVIQMKEGKDWISFLIGARMSARKEVFHISDHSQRHSKGNAGASLERFSVTSLLCQNELEQFAIILPEPHPVKYSKMLSQF